MTDSAQDRARVDRLVDENGTTIAVPTNSAIGEGRDTPATIGATGPTGWWRLGLIALAALVLAVLVISWLGGGTPAPPPA